VDLAVVPSGVKPQHLLVVLEEALALVPRALRGRHPRRVNLPAPPDENCEQTRRVSRYGGVSSGARPCAGKHTAPPRPHARPHATPWGFMQRHGARSKGSHLHQRLRVGAPWRRKDFLPGVVAVNDLHLRPPRPAP